MASKRLIRQQARELVASDLYLYRRIFNIPRGDPRLDVLSDWDLAVELEANKLYVRLITRKGDGTDDEEIDSDPVVEEAIDKLEAGEEWDAIIPEEMSDLLKEYGIEIESLPAGSPPTDNAGKESSP